MCDWNIAVCVTGIRVSALLIGSALARAQVLFGIPGRTHTLSAEAHNSIPGRVRVDGGSEFNHVERFMNTVVGNNQEIRCIRGKSVHNTRIERLWRDMREKVADKYRETFMKMENDGILVSNNDIHKYALHYVYLPRIRRDLQQWRRAWNMHGLRSERSVTPLQLWIKGCVRSQNIDNTAMNNLFRKTKDERLTLIENFISQNVFREPRIDIVVSRVPQPISDVDFARLGATVNVLRPSENVGRDIYLEVLTFIQSCLN